MKPAWIRPEATHGEPFPRDSHSVVHYKRLFALSTETFVVNQVACHLDWRPHVLCRAVLEELPLSTLGPLPRAIGFTNQNSDSSLKQAVSGRVKVPFARERTFYRSMLATLQPRIVHGHFGTDSAYLLSALGETDLPLVVSYYGHDVTRFPRRFGGLGKIYYSKLFARPNTAHVAMTPFMAEGLERLGVRRERIVIHHHGIDTRYWEAASRHAKIPGRVLMVAALDPIKGHNDLLNALKATAESVPQAHLHIVGAGSLERSLRSKVEQLGIQDRVVFRGFLTHGESLLREYGEAMVFAHPSHTVSRGRMEGLPGTVLEAMASGLPVVATRHAGIPYAVEHGSSGILVEERNVGGLAEALSSLLTNEELRKRMGETGRQCAQSSFEIRRQTVAMEELYSNLISECRRA